MAYVYLLCHGAGCQLVLCYLSSVILDLEYSSISLQLYQTNNTKYTQCKGVNSAASSGGAHPMMAERPKTADN
jgi:hypothetical protein